MDPVPSHGIAVSPMPGFSILPRSTFHNMVCGIVHNEISPGRTVTFMHEVDVSAIDAHRRSTETKVGRRPSYTSYVVSAVARALREFPYANRRVIFRRFWGRGYRLQEFHQVDAAIAVERDVPDAPMVAYMDVIRDADRKEVDLLTQELRKLSSATEETSPQWGSFAWIARHLPIFLARWVVLLPTRLPTLWIKYRGGAFLVTSPAKYGVDIVATSWPWPLGVSFGLVRDRCVVLDGKPAVRRTFILTVNWDRRVMAGAQAARFVARVVDILQQDWR